MYAQLHSDAVVLYLSGYLWAPFSVVQIYLLLDMREYKFNVLLSLWLKDKPDWKIISLYIHAEQGAKIYSSTMRALSMLKQVTCGPCKTCHSRTVPMYDSCCLNFIFSTFRSRLNASKQHNDRRLTILKNRYRHGSYSW